MKRVLLLFLLYLHVSVAFSQSYFRTVDGKRIFGNIKQETDSFFMIEVENANRIIKIEKSNLILVEHEENGLTIFRKDLIHPVDPASATTPFYDITNAIYIPISSFRIVQRSGSAKLKMLMLRTGCFNIVDTEEEAHYLLFYVFDDRGADKAYLRVEDRSGKEIYTSRYVPARDLIPWHAGTEPATLLFNNLIKNIKKNKL